MPRIVLTENMIKALKRGLAGWDTTFPRPNDYNKKDSGVNYGRPKDIVRNTRKSTTKDLLALNIPKNTPKGSPADLQRRVVAHELKKRDQPYLKPEHKTKKG